MLFLLFQLGPDRFALDIREVAEVLPLVELTRIPRAPPALAGILNHRGVPVPVIDLSQLLLERAALRRLNTRIVIMHHTAHDGLTHLLGLIAEQMTETARLEPGAFTASGVTDPDSRHAGPVSIDSNGLIQRIDVNRILPASVRELLFQQTLVT